MILQLVEVLIIRPELLEVIIAGEGIKISEDGVAFHMTWIV